MNQTNRGQNGASGILCIKRLHSNVVDNTRKPLVRGNDLLEFLEKSKEPYARINREKHNPVLRIFLCAAWDDLLDHMFFGRNARLTPQVEERITTFVSELIPEMRSEFDATLFGELVVFIQRRGTTAKLVKHHWYDLPAVLRILAPSTEMICVDFSSKKFWMRSVLKGLPHSVIMIPWKEYDVGKYLTHVKDAKDVSRQG